MTHHNLLKLNTMNTLTYLEQYLFELGSTMSPTYFDALITLIKLITK